MPVEVEGDWSDQSDNVIPWTENENLNVYDGQSAYMVVIVWVSLA